MSRPSPWRRGGLLGAGLPLLFTGCAVQQPASLPESPPAVAAPTPSAAPARPVLALEAAQREAARAAAQAGRWADAAWAWDIVLVLAPQDAEAQDGRQRALAQAQAGVAQRLPLAKTARARGQVDLASRLYLEILALSPGHPEAANALRGIERERAKRQAVSGFARRLMLPDASRSGAQADAAARRLDLEHASLLADQGDIDAAIAVLLPTPSSQPGDAASRRLLAQLFFKRADQLADSDRAGAIASLRQVLRWQPRHAQARAQLQRWLAKPAEPASRQTADQAVNTPSSTPSSGR